MANRIKGRNVRIFLNLSSSGDITAGTTVLYATSCDVSSTSQTEKVTDKDTPKGGLTEITGTEWTMSTNNILADDMSNFTELLKQQQLGNDVLIGYNIVSNPNDEGLTGSKKWTAGKGVYGKAKVTSVSSNAPSDGQATLSATFTGSGKLSFKE